MLQRIKNRRRFGKMKLAVMEIVICAFETEEKNSSLKHIHTVIELWINLCWKDAQKLEVDRNEVHDWRQHFTYNSF